MVLGPVFHAELLRTSRRWRYYAARALYGLTLLALIGWTYEGIIRSNPSFAGVVLRHDLLAEAAAQIFWTFISTQVFAVLALTPAMVAGTIADEKQRKTLHYLLASRLTSREIVVGKFAARMFQVGILILVGLPIMSILSLFGGLDPPVVLLAFVGTFSTAFCLGGFSIYVSTVSRRSRDAVILVYVLLAGAFAAPLFFNELFRSIQHPFVEWMKIVGERIGRIDPFQLTKLINPSSGLLLDLTEMIAIQTVVGLFFVGLAAWRLRPAYAKERVVGDGSRRKGKRKLSRAFGLWGHPRVSDDPILWKEMHLARTGIALRLSAILLGIFAFVFMGDALLDLSRPAFAELAKLGYGDSVLIGDRHRARDQLNDFIAMAGAAVYTVWFFGIAASMAGSITSEREEDTWISLIATSLDDTEILRGKALGVLWRWRVVGLTLHGLWFLGLAAGAIHPLGYLQAVIAFLVYTLFGLTIGAFFSVRAKTTTRAMVSTLGWLFLLNGGYMLCLFPLASSFDALFFAPCTPNVISSAPSRYSWMQTLFGSYRDQSIRFDQVATRVLTWTLSLIGYGVATVVLGAATALDFERLVDRPTRPRKSFRIAVVTTEDEL